MHPKTYGDAAFCVIGPVLWSSFPEEVRASDMVDNFQQNLKTFFLGMLLYSFVVS